MKSLFTIIAILFFLNLNAQEEHSIKENVSNQNIYISYSSYRSIKNKGEMKVDSLGVRMFKNDTLIFVSGFVMPKGIKVEYEYKDSLFLETYKELVYDKLNWSKQNDTRDKKQPTMKIWKEPLKVYFHHTVSSKNKRELINFMKFVDKEIDSLKIEFVNSKEKSNYFIYCLNKPSDIDWDTRIKSNDGCFLSWNGKQQIYNNTIKINTQIVFNENQQLMLMKKHFIWSLGYFTYLKNRECKSFLSNCISVEKELTKEDLELLKYHYSYGICKGTDLESFEDNHKRAKKALKESPNSKYYFTHTLK
jgi:hypothetical protein